MKRINCTRSHRMIEIIPGLYLCECSSSGSGATSIAVGTVREMVEKKGGFPALRDRVAAAEAKAVEERREARKVGYARPA